jgi:hypothetical protein
VPAVGGVPTLSQVRGWGTAHLTEAAAQWTTTATVWEDAFTDVATQINHPGGTPWQGVTAQTAQYRAYTDRLLVVGLADQLHDAARIARTGATQIDEARRLVLRTVDSAQSAGFTVGQDFSVTDPRLYDAGTAAIRQAQAEAFATDLRARVGALVATDSGVAGQLTATTAGLGSATFLESGDATTVQLVDYKKEPPPPVDPDKDHPGADQPWKNQPSPRTVDEVKDALRQLRPGRNRPIRELDTPEEIQDFYDWLTGNSAGHAPSSAPFPRERLDDGTIISLRPDSESGGETIGVTLPDGKEGPKVHLPLTPPIISGPPQLPPLVDHPPFAPPLPMPPGPGNTGVTPIPSQGPTIMPGVPLPATPAPGTSAPAPGPALLPQIGHGLADAGGKIVVGGLIGVAILGGLLGIGPGASEATP